MSLSALRLSWLLPRPGPTALRPAASSVQRARSRDSWIVEKDKPGRIKKRKEGCVDNGFLKEVGMGSCCFALVGLGA